VSAETFTREQLMEALTLRPCHVTGTHQPDHHLPHRNAFTGKPTDGYVCNLQLTAALKGLFELLGITEADLPRALHQDCIWCALEGRVEANEAWARGEL
jgi:hypothetical protein